MKSSMHKPVFLSYPAYICSYARLKLLEGLKRHEATALYCDTDSLIYSDVDDIDPGVGENLGEWKYVIRLRER